MSDSEDGASPAPGAGAAAGARTPGAFGARVLAEKYPSVFRTIASARKQTSTTAGNARVWTLFVKYLQTVSQASSRSARAQPRLTRAPALRPRFLQNDLTLRDFLVLYKTEKERLLKLSEAGEVLCPLAGAASRYSAEFAGELAKAAEEYSMNEALQLILVRTADT